MKCPEEFELFQLREGGLDGEREREVAGHVAGCAGCQATLAEIEALGKALGAPEPMTDGERAAFAASVVRRLDAGQQASAGWTGWRRALAIGLPVAAALGCGVFAVAMVPMLSVSREAPMGVATATPPSGAADQGLLERSAGNAEGRQARYGVEEGGGGVALPAPAAPAVEESESGDSYGRGYGLRGSGGVDLGGPARAERQAAARPSGDPRRPGPATGAGDLSVASAPPASSVTIDGMPMPMDMPAKIALPPGQYQVRLQESGYGQAPGLATLGAARAMAAPMAIDPNGRFATTYRPGRGHLARFESAMWRGQAPEAALALVAEVGQGSGPSLPAPSERALDLHVATETRDLAPDGGPIHLAITLRSSAAVPEGRPDLAVHLVMDTSGSMSGAPIEQTRLAASRLVDLLQPSDRLSITSYNSDASLIVPNGPVGSRREAILRQIAMIRAGGGTNLEAGLRLGYDQARLSREGEDSVQLVIVLSDGRANQGLTDPWGLSEMAAAAFQGGCETSSIGVGDEYDPMVMSTIADYGAGGYYYLPDASTIEQVLRAELEVRSQPVARGVELRVRLADGVQLLQAYGSRRLNELEASRVRATEVAIDHDTAHRDGIALDRQEDREGGMRFFIPGFARDDQHTILLRLRVPPGSAGSELVLADLELRYKDRILRQNGGDERRVALRYAPSLQTAMASQDSRVRRAVLTFRTGEALAQVSSAIAAGEQARALAILHERGQLLRAAADRLDDAPLRAEADRLDAFRAMLRSQGIGNRLMLGAIVQRASSGFMR